MNPMPATTADPMTAAEYLALPPIEGKRTELIDGVLFVMSQPLLAHQDAVGAIYSTLRAWSRAAAGRGSATLNIDTAIDEHTVLAPDVQWFAEGRITDRMVRPQPLGDLVVEVRSPSTWHRDLNVKRAKYEQHFAQELWLVDLAAPSVGHRPAPLGRGRAALRRHLRSRGRRRAHHAAARRLRPRRRRDLRCMTDRR